MMEIIALELEIMEALPRVDAAAAVFEAGAPIRAAVRDAQAILCNAWNGPGQRLDALRRIASEMRAA